MVVYLKKAVMPDRTKEMGLPFSERSGSTLEGAKLFSYTKIEE
jgi:hypothetical protein